MNGRRVRGDDGVTIVLFALALVGILLIATTAVDFGNAAQRQRQAQGAADNAALAAAQDLPTTATAVATAAAYSASNVGASSFGGGTACGTTSTCYSSGPWSLKITSPYQGSTYRIKIRLCRSVPSVFGQVVGIDTLTTCASAAARATSGAPGTDILVLAPSGDNAFVCSGSCAISTGSVQVNSTADKGLRVSGGGTIASNTIVVGATSPNGVDNPANVTCNGSAYNTTGCPTTGSTSSDPYAGVVPPTQASVQSTYGTGSCSNTGGTITCTPGVYTSTLTISGGTPGVFQPGIYYLLGGLTVSGGSPVSGTGVFFYNAGAASKFTISGGSSINFTTLNDGSPYGGMLVMQNRSNTQTLTFSGGSSVVVPGTIYNPAGNTTYSGGSGTGTGVAQIVTQTLTVSGASYIGTSNFGAAFQASYELFE